jgi:HAD superfamily hydrolase (TIGR01509 family)
VTADIVFDMDGVLAHTEPLKLRAHRAAVEERGGTLEEALYRREMGGVHGGVVRAFLRESGLDDSPSAVAAYEDRFQEEYRELLNSELAPTPGATEVLGACRGSGRRLVLVTSSERWMAEIVLSRLADPHPFLAVITADDVERTKPHPEPYRRARAALGADAAAVAVEDTTAGVTSASGAGLPVVAVRHALNRQEQFPEAAAEVQSLSPADDFLELVDRLAAGDAATRRPEG